MRRPKLEFVPKTLQDLHVELGDGVNGGSTFHIGQNTQDQEPWSIRIPSRGLGNITEKPQSASFVIGVVLAISYPLIHNQFFIFIINLKFSFSFLHLLK